MTRPPLRRPQAGTLILRGSVLLTAALACTGLLWTTFAHAQQTEIPALPPGATPASPTPVTPGTAAPERPGNLSAEQLTYGKLSFAGQAVQSVTLFGAEYASLDAVRSLLSVTEDGGIVRVTGLGHTLLLPIDEDQQRATTDFNTVQLDTTRVQARTATYVNGTLHLPLDTLARGLGAQYRAGSFTVPAPSLVGVSSRAGKDTDRLVLDLNRDVEVLDEQRGGNAVVTLRGLKGEARKYTTRGAFVPSVTLARSGEDLTLTFPLTAASGLRVFKVVRPGSVRVVVDAGPGVPRTNPELLGRVTRPLVLLDPLTVQGVGRDITLEVARRAALLMTQAGWQVKVTRDSANTMKLDDKLVLTRQSDVYIALDLGRLPGAKRSGVTVYEQAGRSSAQLVNAVRTGSAKPPYAVLAVGNGGNSRKLSELLRGELKGGGVTASAENTTRILTLREAPQAALLMELGWANNAEDLAKLGVDDRLDVMAVSLARSVATYLTARANNNANLSAGGTP
ncbi:N-acetylmuramoyl-L-alanine amidase [Deinococcus enclensis]|uniref:N-acetylmuramoyl-L-alanine amidase n=1 Tax=Deinococcus enclensis TaxID=1049582 RepID=A0ABT9M9M5_9DEIO|nr:N-acetylmuramoyl-L-alanine amidase [Deinococcus enclensis]MDP9763209.1 N-acetylmuramoyl-L-alanine amidase [Deinococcus enclensis]